MLNSLHWWRGILLTFTALWLAKFLLPLPFMNEVIVFSIYTIGCNFLLGRVGFISFGQPAYLAVGAYATAFYLFYFGTNPYIGILIGVGVGIVFAFIVGLLFVRLRRRRWATATSAAST